MCRGFLVFGAICASAALFPVPFFRLHAFYSSVQNVLQVWHTNSNIECRVACHEITNIHRRRQINIGSIFLLCNTYYWYKLCFHCYSTQQKSCKIGRFLHFFSVFHFPFHAPFAPAISSAASNWFDGILITSTLTTCMRLQLFRLLFLAFSMIDILKVIEMNRTHFGEWHCILTLNFTHFKFPLYKNRFDWCDCYKLQISRYISMGRKSLMDLGLLLLFMNEA